MTPTVIVTWSVRSEETWTATKQSWKLEKTLDKVEQADHIIIVVITVFTYRL